MSLWCNYHGETIRFIWIMARKAGTPNGCAQMIMGEDYRFIAIHRPWLFDWFCRNSKIKSKSIKSTNSIGFGFDLESVGGERATTYHRTSVVRIKNNSFRCNLDRSTCTSSSVEWFSVWTVRWAVHENSDAIPHNLVRSDLPTCTQENRQWGFVITQRRQICWWMRLINYAIMYNYDSPSSFGCLL